MRIRNLDALQYSFVNYGKAGIRAGSVAELRPPGDVPFILSETWMSELRGKRDGRGITAGGVAELRPPGGVRFALSEHHGGAQMIALVYRRMIGSP